MFYFTDWKEVLQYVPVWNGKYLHEPPRWFHGVNIQFTHRWQVTDLQWISGYADIKSSFTAVMLLFSAL